MLLTSFVTSKALVHYKVNSVLFEFVASSACQYKGGGLLFESGGKADLLYDHFDNKHSLSYHLHKIRCNSMHPLYGALPVLYVPVLVTRGAVIAHRYTYAPPRCRTSQYRRTFIALSVSPWSVSLWNDLSDPVFDDVELAGFKSKVNAFLLA